MLYQMSRFASHARPLSSQSATEETVANLHAYASSYGHARVQPLSALDTVVVPSNVERIVAEKVCYYHFHEMVRQFDDCLFRRNQRSLISSWLLESLLIWQYSPRLSLLPKCYSTNLLSLSERDIK